jgi:hypothetical protein
VYKIRSRNTVSRAEQSGTPDLKPVFRRSTKRLGVAGAFAGSIRITVRPATTVPAEEITAR